MDMCFPGGGTHITRDMCFLGRGTHITWDICLSGRGTHITVDMCFPGRGTHILGISVYLVGEQYHQGYVFPRKGNSYH